MSTISDTMKAIVHNTQGTFEELIKLLLRKSIKPVLNPTKNNINIIYNNVRGKYEKGYHGSSYDIVNRFSYRMTNDSLGWTEQSLANFKISSKYSKNNALFKTAASHVNSFNMTKTKGKVPFTDNHGKCHTSVTKVPSLIQYDNFIAFLTSDRAQLGSSEGKDSISYTSDIPYSTTFKLLESIGHDIIDQTDPILTGQESAKMSTSMLRVRLYNLEQDLADFSIEYPDIFDAYMEMLRIINSVPRTKMFWVINLIANLSYQRWEDLSDNQMKKYIDIIGKEFIDAFNSNQLIIILLQSNCSEIIIKSSYLYSLLKLLFVTFGYSQIVPPISNKSTAFDEAKKHYYKKYHEKNKGATFRRGVEEECPNRYLSKLMDKFQLNEPQTCTIKEDIPDPEPIEAGVYEFIKLFGDLYPTILGLMGGTEQFPPESLSIGLNDIPDNYYYLTSLPEYLWRFNDYAYCRYIEYVDSKVYHRALAAKVNDKAKYLSNM